MKRVFPILALAVLIVIFTVAIFATTGQTGMPCVKELETVLQKATGSGGMNLRTASGRIVLPSVNSSSALVALAKSINEAGIRYGISVTPDNVLRTAVAWFTHLGWTSQGTGQFGGLVFSPPPESRGDFGCGDLPVGLPSAIGSKYGRLASAPVQQALWSVASQSAPLAGLTLLVIACLLVMGLTHRWSPI